MQFNNILQSHDKAKKNMTKPFPLYVDLASLCEAVIATGAGAFRATCGGLSDHDAEGSEDEADPSGLASFRGGGPGFF